MDERNNIDKEREIAEEKLVGDAFQRLLNDYLSTRHRKKVDIITKAFNFAKQAHKGVRRLSGEPYIMHPIADRMQRDGARLYQYKCGTSARRG